MAHLARHSRRSRGDRDAPSADIAPRASRAPAALIGRRRLAPQRRLDVVAEGRRNAPKRGTLEPSDGLGSIGSARAQTQDHRFGRANAVPALAQAAARVYSGGGRGSARCGIGIAPARRGSREGGATSWCCHQPGHREQLPVGRLSSRRTNRHSGWLRSLPDRAVAPVLSTQPRSSNATPSPMRPTGETCHAFGRAPTYVRRLITRKCRGSGAWKYSGRRSASTAGVTCAMWASSASL